MNFPGVKFEFGEFQFGSAYCLHVASYSQDFFFAIISEPGSLTCNLF
jgi:hypothetical protein